MAKIVKVTDLTKTEGDPSPRAEVRLQREPLESYTFKIKMPAWLGGGTIEIDTRTRDGSRLAGAIVTFLVIAAGCLAVAAGIGAAAAGFHVPAWALGVAFLIPTGIYVLINHLGGRSTE